MDYRGRCGNAGERLASRGRDVCLITDPSHIFYLTGLKEVEGFLLITRRDVHFFTGGIYLQESRDLLPASLERTVHIRALSPDALCRFLGKFRRRAALGSGISAERVAGLEKKTGGRVELLDDFILEMRAVKDADELALIRRAHTITLTAIANLRPLVRPGVRELDLLAEIRYQMLVAGADGEGFKPVVASGANGAYPHHKAGTRRVEEGDAVVVDVGAEYRGYGSDLTETFLVGACPSAVRNAYRALEDVHAQLAGRIVPGMSCRKLHEAAVACLRKRKLHRLFLHGLGHGVGIQVHEKPHIFSKSRDILRKGMICAIEPGVYFPGKFGIRLERMYFL
jgi:Xaa-Pro aminopeptidase